MWDPMKNLKYMPSTPMSQKEMENQCKMVSEVTNEGKKKMYQIWCTIEGGITKLGTAWYKADNKIWQTEDEEEAEKKAKWLLDRVLWNYKGTATFTYEIKEV